jgi:hypothetical protein
MAVVEAIVDSPDPDLDALRLDYATLGKERYAKGRAAPSRRAMMTRHPPRRWMACKWRAREELGLMVQAAA